MGQSRPFRQRLVEDGAPHPERKMTHAMVDFLMHFCSVHPTDAFS
jgi:hypothetical protein